jgi:hypothetical protein
MAASTKNRDEISLDDMDDDDEEEGDNSNTAAGAAAADNDEDGKDKVETQAVPSSLYDGLRGENVGAKARFAAKK